MSIMLQAMLFEQYGPRLSMDQLAQVLGVSRGGLYNMVSAGNCPVRTYLDCGKRWADYRDVAEHLDVCRSTAN